MARRLSLDKAHLHSGTGFDEFGSGARDTRRKPRMCKQHHASRDDETFQPEEARSVGARGPLPRFPRKECVVLHIARCAKGPDFEVKKSQSPASKIQERLLIGSGKTPLS